MDMVSSTWLAISGSGPRIGIEPTTTRLWPGAARLRSIRKDLQTASTLVSREYGREYTGEVHFFARINTARAISQADAGKENPTPERITSVSAAWSTRQLQERSWRMRGCPQGNDGHSKRRSVSAEEFSNSGALSRQLMAGNRKRFIRVDDVPTHVKKRFRIEADPFERTWEDSELDRQWQT